MARQRNSTRKLRIVAATVIVLTLGGFVYFIHHEADGLRNAISPGYWSDRAQGLDEYEPKFAYFKRGARDRKEVCLTFDDGPHGTCTQQELAALRQAHVPAAFFVVGKRMKQHPKLIREMLAEGMEVGNHTETHPRLSAIPLTKARQEVEECEGDFEKITGRRMTLFRPPGMRDNPAVLKMVKSLGYQTIGWNVGAHDFSVGKNDPKVSAHTVQELSRTPEQIAQRVLANVKNGSIILLHDQPDTAKALPTILAALRKEGYRFVSCTAALQHISHPIAVAANPSVSHMRVAKHVPAHPHSPLTALHALTKRPIAAEIVR